MLSIIVTHYRSYDLLAQCLRKIEQACVDLEYEIMVSDSASLPDKLAQAKKQFPQIEFLAFKDNLGFVRLANVGLKRAQGEFILLTQADVLVDKKGLMAMLAYMQKHAQAGVLGPRLIGKNGQWQPSCFREYKPLTFIYRRTFLGKTKLGQKDLARFLYQDKDLTKVQPVVWHSHAVQLIRREILDKIGLLDEGFIHYFSDVDLCRRIWQNGYKVIYFPSAQFVHGHGKSSQGGFFSIFNNRFTRIHIKDAWRYFIKY